MPGRVFMWADIREETSNTQLNRSKRCFGSELELFCVDTGELGPRIYFSFFFLG